MEFVLLRARQLGMPPEFIDMYLDLLHKAKFYFASKGSAIGQCYSNSLGHFVAGPGQGATSATYAWTFDSTCAMHILDANHSGMQFCTPDRTVSIKRSIEGIVDDTSILSNLLVEEMENNQKCNWEHMKARKYAQDCTKNMATMAQHWEKLLWSTGGALELPKCWYYLVHWNFDSIGNPTMLTKHQMAHFQLKTIQIENSSGDSQTIEQKDITEHARTLGYMACPSGNQQGQFTHIISKARDLARALSATYANEQEAKKFFFTIALPSLTYAN
jgi:hypothetical protein